MEGYPSRRLCLWIRPFLLRVAPVAVNPKQQCTHKRREHQAGRPAWHCKGHRMVSQRGVLSSVYDVRCSPPHQFNRDAVRGRGHTLKTRRTVRYTNRNEEGVPAFRSLRGGISSPFRADGRQRCNGGINAALCPTRVSPTPLNQRRVHARNDVFLCTCK